MPSSAPSRSFAVACAAAVMSLAGPAAAQESEFSLVASEEEAHLDILRDGRVVARYMHAHIPEGPEAEHTTKPYLHVFDPTGEFPITKGPGGRFPHHRGIFIGWNRIEVGGRSYDRWHMQDGAQIHREFTDQRAESRGASITSRVEWMGRGDDVILEERRTMTLMPAPEPAYLMIDFTSTLQAVAGETKLGGDREHAGIQYRPANEVDATKTLYYFPGENADPRRQLDFPWLGQTYVLDGKEYSVVYLNHPENTTDTQFSAYRDYGRFGGFYQTTLPKDGEVTYRVRFLIVEGGMPPVEWIQAESNRYSGRNEPTPALTEREAG